MSDKIPKLVHFTVVVGTEEEIKALGTVLGEMKQKLPFEIEFLVTNDRIQLTDLKFLLAELIKLYKNYKAIKESKEKKK